MSTCNVLPLSHKDCNYSSKFVLVFRPWLWFVSSSRFGTMAFRRYVFPSLLEWLVVLAREKCKKEKKKGNKNMVTNMGGPVSSMRGPRCGGPRHMGNVTCTALRGRWLCEWSTRHVVTCALSFLSYDPIPSRHHHPLFVLRFFSSHLSFFFHLARYFSRFQLDEIWGQAC